MLTSADNGLFYPLTKLEAIYLIAIFRQIKKNLDKQFFAYQRKYSKFWNCIYMLWANRNIQIIVVAHL